MTRFPLLLTVATICVLSSCASNDAARRLAATTASQLASYEKQIDQKITAESALYRNQTAAIATLESNPPRVKLAEEGASDEQISLPQLRIRANASADAIRVWDGFVAADYPEARKLIAEHLAQGIARDRAVTEGAIEARRRLQQEFIESLAKLTSQKSKITAARKNLEELSKKSTPAQSLRDAIDFARQLQNELEVVEASGGS